MQAILLFLHQPEGRVVQWIVYGFPEPRMQVRFLPRLLFFSQTFLLIYITKVHLNTLFIIFDIYLLINISKRAT